MNLLLDAIVESSGFAPVLIWVAILAILGAILLPGIIVLLIIIIIASRRRKRRNEER